MNRILVGNEAVNNRLRGTLSHAYLIAGQEGSGRSIVIETLARKALCQNVTTDRLPCGNCNACKKMNHHSHPDYKTYGWEKPLSAEQVRDLKKQVHVRPNDGSRAVFVLYRADQLHQGNQNILLKTLEEPPSHGIFILVSGESGGVIETIQSRCQLLVLRPVPEELLLAYLKQRYPNGIGLEDVAKRSGGVLGKSLLELEPERRLNMNQVKEETHPQAEEFHLGKTGRRKPVPKKEVPPPMENRDLVERAEKIVDAMVKQQELRLLESAIALEKLDKGNLLAVLELISEQLSQYVLREKKRHIYQCIYLVEEILQAVERNVGGAQVVGWLTAGSVVGKKGG